LLFLRPEEVEFATAVFRKHALKEDGYEPGAQEHRFTVTPIDEKFGSATGYIAKYISKNIDGYGMDGELDDESGQPVKEMAKRVRAWASRWNIRQFQQIGGAPVTTWRELRRLGNRELVLHPEIEEREQPLTRRTGRGTTTPRAARWCPATACAFASVTNTPKRAMIMVTRSPK
jgi:hypothetical protein